MSGPGKGRYTDYVQYAFSSGQSAKLKRLHRNFNTNPMINPGAESNPGIFYGATDKTNQESNVKAASAVTQNYVKNLIDDLYTSTVSKDVVKDLKVDKELAKDPVTGLPEDLVYFTGNGTNDLPDTSKLDDSTVVSNSYMPVLISPGAVKDAVNFTIIFDKKADSRAAVGKDGYKPNLIIPETPDDKENLGTLSPHNVSRLVGSLSIVSIVSLGTSKKLLEKSKSSA